MATVPVGADCYGLVLVGAVFNLPVPVGAGCYDPILVDADCNRAKENS